MIIFKDLLLPFLIPANIDSPRGLAAEHVKDNINQLAGHPRVGVNL